jgi:hypothetical protein
MLSLYWQMSQQMVQNKYKIHRSKSWEYLDWSEFCIDIVA